MRNEILTQEINIEELLNKNSPEKSYIQSVQDKYGVMPNADEIDLFALKGLVKEIEKSLPKLERKNSENISVLEKKRDEYIKSLNNNDASKIIRAQYAMQNVAESAVHGSEMNSYQKNKLQTVEEDIKKFSSYVNSVKAINNLNQKIKMNAADSNSYNILKAKTYNTLTKLAQAAGIGGVEIKDDLSNAHELLRTGRRALSIDPSKVSAFVPHLSNSLKDKNYTNRDSAAAYSR